MPNGNETNFGAISMHKRPREANRRRLENFSNRCRVARYASISITASTSTAQLRGSLNAPMLERVW